MAREEPGLQDLQTQSTLKKQQQQTRHALSDDKHQQIYNYWLNEKVSIPTTDRRSGRDEMKIGKLQ